MTIEDQIKDQKLQYDINREAKKMVHIVRKKMISVNILQVNEYHLLIKNK